LVAEKEGETPEIHGLAFWKNPTTYSFRAGSPQALNGYMGWPDFSFFEAAKVTLIWQ